MGRLFALQRPFLNDDFLSFLAKADWRRNAVQLSLQSTNRHPGEGRDPGAFVMPNGC